MKLPDFTSFKSLKIWLVLASVAQLIGISYKQKMEGSFPGPTLRLQVPSVIRMDVGANQLMCVSLSLPLSKNH